jgi:hypothetical protein
MTDTEQPIEYMLTTVDNPFNPFTQWNEWLAYDYKLGYDTPGMLARIAKVSNDLSEPDQALAIQQAIDEIVKENVSGMWRKVSKNSFENL